MQQLFLKKLFSMTCTLRGKKDVQLTFDYSYLCYVSRIDVLKISFVFALKYFHISHMTGHKFCDAILTNKYGS